MFKFFRKSYLSLRGGTTRQSVKSAIISYNAHLLRTETIQTLAWDLGSIMRLPRRGAPRNDEIFK